MPASAVATARRASRLPLSYLTNGQNVPDDIARVVVFACSDLAVFMTGSVLAVDAGSLAH